MSRSFTRRVEDDTDHTHNASDNYYKTYRCEFCGGAAYTQHSYILPTPSGRGANIIRVWHAPFCVRFNWLQTAHPGIFYDWGAAK